MNANFHAWSGSMARSISVAMGISASLLVVSESFGDAGKLRKNLAYEDGFVWYLSGRLAGAITELQLRSGVELSEGQGRVRIFV